MRPPAALQLRAADGVAVSVDRYGDRHAAAVIVCPGFFQSKETRTFRRMSQALAQGRAVLAMDFRGHGRSGGWYTFSAQEGQDLAAVLDWAAPRYAALAVLGFSLGGAIAINTVSQWSPTGRSRPLTALGTGPERTRRTRGALPDARPSMPLGIPQPGSRGPRPRDGAAFPFLPTDAVHGPQVGGSLGAVRSLIAVSAPSAFDAIEFRCWMPEAWRTGWAGLEQGAGCRPGNPLLPKARPVDRIRALAGIPLLLLHGTRDVIVAEAHSRRLYEAAAEPKRLTLIEHGSHAEALFRDDPGQFLQIVDAWLAASGV